MKRETRRLDTDNLCPAKLALKSWLRENREAFGRNESAAAAPSAHTLRVDKAISTARLVIIASTVMLAVTLLLILTLTGVLLPLIQTTSRSTSSSSSSSSYSASSTLYSSRLRSVADFIASQYNQAIGLVFATRQSGSFTLSYPFNETYWLFNDNAELVWALLPYYLKLSQSLNSSINTYAHDYRLPSSDYAEVLWGLPIRGNLSVADNIVVLSGSTFVVLDEIHSSSTLAQWSKFANTLIIHCLNNYLRGNLTGSMSDFNSALNMWDGRGIQDTATQADSGNATTGLRYTDYKLAYIIYAAHILKIWNRTLSAMESALWSHQLLDGSVAVSYTSAGASKFGNAETNADVLLAYDNELIARMQSLFGAYSNLSSGAFL